MSAGNKGASLHMAYNKSLESKIEYIMMLSCTVRRYVKRVIKTCESTQLMHVKRQ